MRNEQNQAKTDLPNAVVVIAIILAVFLLAGVLLLAPVAAHGKYGLKAEIVPEEAENPPAEPGASPLTGKWRTNDLNGSVYELEFFDDGTCMMKNSGEAFTLAWDTEGTLLSFSLPPGVQSRTDDPLTDISSLNIPNFDYGFDGGNLVLSPPHGEPGAVLVFTETDW